jgi:hypothetical protein
MRYFTTRHQQEQAPVEPAAGVGASRRTLTASPSCCDEAGATSACEGESERGRGREREGGEGGERERGRERERQTTWQTAGRIVP